MEGPALKTPAPEALELMRAIAERQDRHAFKLIFEEYAPKLKAFLRRGGLDDGAAEEVVQDVMLSVWRRASTFDAAQGGLSAWIFAIARNRRIDYLRRAPRPALAEDGELARLEDPGPSAEGLVERKQSHTSLGEALLALPQEQAEILRLAFFEQKSHSIIAQERELPLGTVKSRIRLALRQLRRVLEPQQ